jgi:hypothetical protein
MWLNRPTVISRRNCQAHSPVEEPMKLRLWGPLREFDVTTKEFRDRYLKFFLAAKVTGDQTEDLGLHRAQQGQHTHTHEGTASGDHP